MSEGDVSVARQHTHATFLLYDILQPQASSSMYAFIFQQQQDNVTHDIH